MHYIQWMPRALGLNSLLEAHGERLARRKRNLEDERTEDWRRVEAERQGWRTKKSGEVRMEVVSTT